MWPELANINPGEGVENPVSENVIVSGSADPDVVASNEPTSITGPEGPKLMPDGVLMLHEPTAPLKLI
jgi:hypothetical protein